jgi:hypothetical protein
VGSLSGRSVAPHGSAWRTVGCGRRPGRSAAASGGRRPASGVPAPRLAGRRHARRRRAPPAPPPSRARGVLLGPGHLGQHGPVKEGQLSWQFPAAVRRNHERAGAGQRARLRYGPPPRLHQRFTKRPVLFLEPWRTNPRCQAPRTRPTRCPAGHRLSLRPRRRYARRRWMRCPGWCRF